MKPPARASSPRSTATPRRRAALWLAAGLASRAAAAPAADLYALPDSWTDDHQQTVHLAAFRGHAAIMTMAYAGCSRVCAVTLHKLEALQQQADEMHRDIEFVVFGYNPDLDTPQVWASYRRQHHLERDNWHFLTGSQDSTHHIAGALGMDYWLYEDHVMHDFKIVSIDPLGHPLHSINWDEKNQSLF